MPTCVRAGGRGTAARGEDVLWHPESLREGAAASDQQAAVLEPAVSWTEMASQQSSRYSRTNPAGRLLREGFSRSMVWQWDREDPLETQLASNHRLLSQQSLLGVPGV